VTDHIEEKDLELDEPSEERDRDDEEVDRAPAPGIHQRLTRRHTTRAPSPVVAWLTITSRRASC
jgi:hypothetical protein